MQQGMQLLDQALVNLYREKCISRESVFAFCNDREQAEKLIGGNNSSSAKVQNSLELYSG